MSWGRRCEVGCESWPDDDGYCYCPKCGEPTTRYRNLEPLDDDEAADIVSALLFDHYYETEHEPDLALTREEEHLIEREVKRLTP